MGENQTQVLENRIRFVNTVEFLFENNSSIQRQLEIALNTLQYTCAHKNDSEILDRFKIIYNSYQQKLLNQSDLKYQIELFIKKYQTEHILIPINN